MKELFLKKQTWIVPEDLNIYIITGEECNCKCKYCVGCLKENIYKKKITDKKYYKKLSNMLKSLRNEIWSVTILGGEPTISPRIFNILKIIKDYKFKKVMTTNGILLKNKSFLSKINKSSLDHLNISRHDFNDKKNSILFQNVNVPNTKELKIIVKNIKSSIKLRINCNLIKGHIDNVNNLKKFINHVKNIGINEISFSELSHMDNDYITKKKIIDFCNKNRVSINNLITQIKKDKKFKLISEDIKEDYKSKIFNFIYKDTKIQIRTVNTSLKEKELFSHRNKIYSLKFHPNAILSASWNPCKKIVL